MTTSDFSLDIPISFGHCDPAGIVFYPNYFRWFDRCLHSFLKVRAAGHGALCARLGAVGLGLMDVGASFPAPARDGDVMRLSLRFDTWSSRTVRLAYAGEVDGRTVVEGHELRGMFVEHDGRLRAGELSELRAILTGTP